MNVRQGLIFAVAIGLLGIAGTARGAVDAGVGWQRVAEARYAFLWQTITTGELYVDAGAPAPADRDIQNPGYSKRLRIEYGVGVSRERFVAMARESLEANWPRDVLAANQVEIDRFCDWMQDVEKGDWYTVSWDAQRGFTLALNDRPVGAWDNPEAAHIILSLWLGRAAVSDGQRDKLLAQWRAWLSQQAARD